MRSIRYFCDRCGAEVVNIKELCRVGFEYDEDHFPHASDKEFEMMESYQDLCPNCTHEITKFIMNNEEVGDKE